MRTLILGARGQLGRDLTHIFSARGELLGLDLPELDVADPGAVERAIDEFTPDLVLNAAAFTDVEAAEDHEAAAFAANETGAANAARACADRNIPIAYYSTDYVFGGTKTTPYSEDDPVSPIGVYARSKWAGEEATRHANPQHVILRTAWLYGPGGNNFIEKILRAASTRPELQVVEDEVGSPTHTKDLAEATAALVDANAHGTYHAVNRGTCSRFAFAKEILRLARVDTPVRPCGSDAFHTKAERPLYSALDTTKIKRACGYEFRTWEDALADYMNRREKIDASG